MPRTSMKLTSYSFAAVRATHNLLQWDHSSDIRGLLKCRPTRYLARIEQLISPRQDYAIYAHPLQSSVRLRNAWCMYLPSARDCPLTRQMEGSVLVVLLGVLLLASQTHAATPKNPGEQSADHVQLQPELRVVQPAVNACTAVLNRNINFIEVET